MKEAQKRAEYQQCITTVLVIQLYVATYSANEFKHCSGECASNIRILYQILPEFGDNLSIF